MKLRILTALLLCLTACPALCPAWAQTAPRTLTMSGHGEVQAVPDTAIVNTGVTSSGATAAAALATNNTRTKGVFTALTALGVADRDIQTTGFNVAPQYTEAPNQPRRLTGYQASNQISVRLSDVTRAGAVIDALVNAGANEMNGVSFAIRDSDPLLAQAREKAVADARSRAETYAKAAGVDLGSILSISEGGAVEAPRPMYRMVESVVVTGSRIAAGQQSVTADVTIVWEIH
jgi:uncharacterized protein YggE